jgi:hypothetical protein
MFASVLIDAGANPKMIVRCPAVRGPYTLFMATAVKKLDLHEGELVEIDGRRYEVVPDKVGGLTLEPPITPMAGLDAIRGTAPASAEDFERFATGIPHDDEG